MGKIKPPSKQTLRKYGLTEQDWLMLLHSCDRICPICEREFGVIYGSFSKATRPLQAVIDHVHVRGYKKMKPENKRQYVRGLLCNWCNRRMVGRGMDLRKARNIVKYLENYEARTREVR